MSIYQPKNSRKENHEITITGNLQNETEFYYSTVIPLFRKFISPKIYVKKRPKGGRIDVHALSKEFVKYAHSEWNFPIGKKKNIKIPEKFLESWDLTKNVISGIFATDGSVIFSKQHRDIPYYPRIEITNSSQPLLNQLLQLYHSRDYKACQWCNKVSVNGFESSKLFRKEVGFLNPKHTHKFQKSMGP